MKILISTKDIYTQVDKRPLFHEIAGEISNCILKIKKDNPFVKYKSLRTHRDQLLRLYYKRRYITFLEYLISRVAGASIEVVRLLWILMRGKIRVNLQYKDSGCYSDGYITVNMARSFPEYFRDENVCIINICLNEVWLEPYLTIKAMLYMVRYGVLSFWHCYQYLVIKRDVDTLYPRTSKFVIEEGLNTIATYIAYAHRSNDGYVIITQRFIMAGQPQLVYLDEIIDNNIITYNKSIKYYKKVRLDFFNPDINIKIVEEKKVAFGYAIDLGTFYLNKKDKNYYDQVIALLSKNENTRMIYSVHPQEQERALIYDRLFDAECCEARGELSIEEYLSKIDILITWWSTLVIQAIACSKFVILLDFFGDKQGEELDELIPNIVKRAICAEDIMRYAKMFRQYDKKAKDQLFSEAHKILFNINYL